MKAFAVGVALLVAACGDKVLYHWDGADVICSAAIDDIDREPRWGRVESRLETAGDVGDVAVFHAHQPGGTINVESIAWLFERAAYHGLETVRFDELVPGARARPGLALAFDDDDIAGWFGIRELLASFGAKVTFFICRWGDLTPEELDMIATLAADGHDIQPHGALHIHARDYVAANGLDAYLADEVLPSIQAMTDAGFAPTTFAFPFGETDPDITDAVLGHIDRVRTTLSDCPY